jgi:Transglutaminase-like superfamily
VPRIAHEGLRGILQNGHRFFRGVWWSANLLLGLALVCLIYAGAWELSVRQYLRGFSDAIVPAAASPEQKAEAILDWMRSGAPRSTAVDPAALPQRDPETTLNYQQLLDVCGTATNAFLNLSRSAGLSSRRLLLLDARRQAKHVVAEVLIDGRWVVVDPTYRVFLRDADGRLLTRYDLRDRVIFAQATSAIPHYLPHYSYENVAHLRLARLPMDGFHLRGLLNAIAPGWEEAADWSLLLERESYFVFFTALLVSFFLFFLRTFLAWYADKRLKIARFRLRERVVRVGEAFFSPPELK